MNEKNIFVFIQYFFFYSVRFFQNTDSFYIFLSIKGLVKNADLFSKFLS